MGIIQSAQSIIDDEHTYLVQSYARPDFVISRGAGVTLYDSNGKAYDDWVSGIAVNALGYDDAGLKQVIYDQLATGVLHVSNLYHTQSQVELARALVEHSFADRVFFSNSGAEANEGAIKFARKLAYSRNSHEKREVVCFNGAFHGRTLAALSLTPKEQYQKPFHPLMPGVHVGEFNHMDSARSLIHEKTAAVIVEPVQGEGGVHVATDEFLQGLRELCDRHGAVLIFDEVQCGLGRAGTLWAHEVSGATPDIMTLAKPLAGGLPLGAILVTEEVSRAIQPGDHGSTFAGGPLVTRVGKYVFDRACDPQFLAHVRDVGAYLQERLMEINSPLIKEVRGRGLMVGLELTIEVAPIIRAGYEHGLLLANAGPNTLRFIPPLIVENEHVDLMIERLVKIMETLHV